MSAPARRYGLWDAAGVRCPDCGTRVGEMRLSFGEPLLHLLGGPPIRQPTAERDDVRAYRAGRLDPRPHHGDDRIAAERHDSTLPDEEARRDHHDLDEPRIDTWCRGCGARLRVDLADS